MRDAVQIQSASKSGQRLLRAPVWIVTIGLIAWGVTSANPFLTALAIGALPLIALLVWRAGEPPILFFICVMQWLQAVVLLLYANFFTVTLSYIEVGPAVIRAIFLSICGVLALALGTRIGLLGAHRSRAEDLKTETSRIDINKVFQWYLGSFVITLALDALSGVLSPLRQPLLACAGIKWVFVFVLAYAVLLRRERYNLLIICMLMEIVLGTLGFFAAFKNVFFIVLIAGSGLYGVMRGRGLVLAISLGMLLVFAGSVWTAVKGEYREFLNMGYDTQEVLVPVEERFPRLVSLVSSFDTAQLIEGFQTLVLRVSYVEFFTLTITNVPEPMPYEHGALWADAIKRAFLPRLFFPEKAVIDDSERTALYTGMPVSGTEQGTSISIGYFAESYIDFGPLFMFIPIILVGIVYGLIYRCFVVAASSPLLGSGVASAILAFIASNIETTNSKIVGLTAVSFLVMLPFYKAFLKWFTLR
ncbi:MAG: hypothetical protein ACR2IV_13975 [Bryobacteraceae bacterium]